MTEQQNATLDPGLHPAVEEETGIKNIIRSNDKIGICRVQ